MKKRLPAKIPKLRSKKGITLIEILVGVAIIVIVFGATLSAMTNGYSKVLYNAETNKSAAEGGSINEVILEAVKRQGFANAEECFDYFTNADNAVHGAAKSADDTIQYVNYAQFPVMNIDNQYAINMEAESIVSTENGDHRLKGLEILTSINSVEGVVVNRSFVAYTEQET